MSTPDDDALPAPDLATLDPATYEKLRRIAARMVGRYRHPTLTATMLLHEGWLKLQKSTELRIQSRKHFVSLVVCTFRQLITDRLRSRMARKRDGGPMVPLTLDGLAGREMSVETLLQISQAVDALAQRDPLLARLCEARYFVGMSVAEIATEFEMPKRTVERSLQFVRAWFETQVRGRRSARGGTT
jgi:RNA polymerase sigma factor (TIGR02999 family)